MAYTNSWDEAAPAGSVAANTLETIIQNVKKDMRERLEDAFPDWSDDAVDPKRVVMHSGTLANRPAPADANTGEFYYATDTDQLFYFDSAAWVQLISNEQVANLDADAGAGSQASSEDVAAFSMSLSLTGTTDASGDIVIDLGEMEAFDGYTSPATYLNTLIAAPITPTTLATLQISATTASTITLKTRDFAGAALATTAIAVDIYMTFR